MALSIKDMITAFEKGQFTLFSDFLKKAIEEIEDPNRGYEFIDLAYNGFEPKSFIKNLIRKYQQKGEEANFLKHTIVICKLFSTRGTKWEKIKGKLNEKGTAIMAEIQRVSGLCDNTKNAVNVTIGRWACCFPSIVGHMMKDEHGGVSRIVCDKYGFPSWLSIPGVLGLFDKEFVGESICRAAAVMYFCFSERLTEYITDNVPGANPVKKTGNINQTILVMRASMGKALSDGELSLDQLIRLGIICYDDMDNVSAWGAVGVKIYQVGAAPSTAVDAGCIRLCGFTKVEATIDDIFQTDNAKFTELQGYINSIQIAEENKMLDYSQFRKMGGAWNGCDQEANVTSDPAKLHGIIANRHIVTVKK